MRLFNIAEQESFLLNRHGSRRLSVLGSNLDGDCVLTFEVRVAGLTEALLDARQEIAELQDGVEPHLGQG